jgi:predicted nuclease of predicted toxin-antitoxin system
MKILLDECVTRYLKRDLAPHEVFTVEEAGFKGLKNGRLLQAASGQYDVLITVDQNLTYQQNLKSFRIAVVLLTARRSTYSFLRPLMPRVLDELNKIKAGSLVVVKA